MIITANSREVILYMDEHFLIKIIFDELHQIILMS